MGLILLGTLLISLPEVVLPPGRDQGIFLYHGLGLLGGLVPYLNMWDHKPPGIYFIYALALGIFGNHFKSINLIDILWRLATVYSFYLLGRRLYGGREGLLSSLIYGFTSSAFFTTFWGNAQAEGFMIIFLVLSVYYYPVSYTHLTLPTNREV
mgnify:CR=1 FL=1